MDARCIAVDGAFQSKYRHPQDTERSDGHFWQFETCAENASEATQGRGSQAHLGITEIESTSLFGPSSDFACAVDFESWSRSEEAIRTSTTSTTCTPLLGVPAAAGLASVFGPCSSTFIREVCVKTDQSELQRASTGILFPAQWCFNDSLLSIEISQDAISYFVHELFNSQVLFLEGVTTITRTDGQTLTCSDSKVILRGARLGAIAKLLGPVISTAIEGTSIRQQEIQEGKDTTHCVSMTVMKDHGMVDIYLSSNIGLDIAQRLGLAASGR